MLPIKLGGVNGRLKRLDSPLYMEKKGVLKITPEAKEKLAEEVEKKHESVHVSHVKTLALTQMKSH